MTYLSNIKLPFILSFLVLTSCSQSEAEIAKTNTPEPDVAVIEEVKVVETLKEDSIPANITDLLQSRISGISVTKAVKTPLNGVFQSSFDDKYAYLLDGGRYVIIGDLIDLKNANNITELARRTNRVDQLAKFDDTDMIVYPAKNTVRESITIFTDTSCPYCKKLHEEVGALQEAGITVKYLPYPRGSKRGPGYKKLQQVWCAKDRPYAMHVAKGTELGEVDNDGSCEQAKIVDEGFVVGDLVGVSGTPSIINSRGKKIDGYVPANQLIPMILN